MIPRILNMKMLLEKSSYFLFGPRLSGKSKLISMQLSEEAFVINLLKSSQFLDLSVNPHHLPALIKAQNRTLVVIDEIQRIPQLLNEVHALIEEDQYRFLLTGSSGKQLKKSGVNLLAGRARITHLYPLTSFELGKDFNLMRYLNYGGLPKIYLSDDPNEDLYTYVDAYLREEIQAEAFVRKIASFMKFLEIAALTNGQLLNFSNISSDTGVSVSTIREYYFLLEDTFLGFVLEPFVKTKKRKALSTAKFYFFDLGVVRTIAGLKELDPKTESFGVALEHLIALELRAYIGYHRKRLKISFFRSVTHEEVDFIVEDQIAIEVKSSDRIKDKFLKNLKDFEQEGLVQRLYLVSLDPNEKIIDGIHCLPVEAFLQQLWQGKIIL